jgi:hypothetical protein
VELFVSDRPHFYWNRLFVAAGTALTSSFAQAQVAIDFIGSCYATDVSADGSVIVGNTVDVYETFRWTADGGLVPLGRATVPVIGTGAGTPDVSADGTRISATIIDDTGSYATQGVWTLGSGWQECMPPTPLDGGLMDNSYGSGWGISGDGNALVGLYWRPGQPGGSAHPSRWAESTGVVDLGTQGGGSCDTCGSGRANAANFNGSIIVGWVENPDFGNWWPTVWVNGDRTVLKETEGFASAEEVNPDGSIIVGSSWFAPVTQFSVEEAAVWRWNGGQWVEQRIGKLPGTAGPFGHAACLGVSADGSMIVGFNRLSTGDTGFVWTQATGMISGTAYLTSQGASLPADYILTNLTGISNDGSTIIGTAFDNNAAETVSFTITRCVLRGDINKDTNIDGADIAGFVRAKLGESAEAGENPVCANYGGTLDEDIAAFTADLLGS